MSTGRSGQRVADIQPTRLALLNAGAAEAATLTECLAVDFAALMRATLPETGADAIAAMHQAAEQGISRRMALAARLIHQQHGMAAVEELDHHRSDTVRGWACFMIGAAGNMALADRLAAIRPFADDHHFGVREWSWMAVRPHIAANPDSAIACRLDDRTVRAAAALCQRSNPPARRVVCHLGVLRQSPEKALPVLEPLRADPAAYVQDSVGNWLNDAGKDRPDWGAVAVCPMADRKPPRNRPNLQRALRSIDRKG